MPEQAMVPLPGSERQEQPGATRIGPVPDDETIQFSVVVRARKGAPDMEEVARNASITGKFLSREELAAATAPDPADVQAVEEYAHRNGLTVEQVDPVTRRVKLAGSAAAVKQAFGVSLDRYELGSRTFRGRTGPVLVPESLADVVVGVLGTDDRPMAHRLATLAPQFVSGSSVPMSVVQMASYYNYPADLDGTGQCIGIIEFGGGYLIQDINAYFSGLGLKTPPIVDVPLDGGSNTPTPGTGPTPNDYTVEVEADIEIAGSAAPGASLAVYFVGNDSTNNLLDAVNAAIGDTANNPSVLSISYGTAEDSNPPQNIAPVNLALASAGAVGITVLIASGDNGSMGRWQQGPPDALAHVNFAASSPNATGVGGTVLQPNGSGGVAAEVVWNNNATTSASGGGVSNYFNTVPTFQSGAGINPVSANPPGNTGRGVPDVSANADSYQVYIRGQNASITGTSAATPLWAGLFARVNQGIGGRAGLPLATLYGPLLTAGALNDITTGDNGAYTAGPGWDACTGLGSPNGTAILTGWRKARQVTPTVTGLSESSGSAGDQLVVTGTGFLGATAVNFGTVTAGLLAPASDTQITVAVPSGPASGTTVHVTVTAPGGTSADVPADQFTFLTGPQVTAISPSSGSANATTQVTITGSGFTGATDVSFGPTRATAMNVDSDTQITAASPAGTGTVDVTVTTPAGTSATTPADQFTFLTGLQVTAISPSSGSAAGGDQLTITGSGFTGATDVSFGPTSATAMNVDSDTQITAASPAGTGTVDVTVTTPAGTSATTPADQFTYM